MPTETAAAPASGATPAPSEAPASSPAPNTTGRGGGGGRGNNNRNNRRGNRGGQQQEQSSGTTSQPKPARFEGRCDKLKGHIYDCSDNRQTDGYTKTMSEIAEYIGKPTNTGLTSERPSNILTHP
jgi:hypothetical protein